MKERARQTGSPKESMKVRTHFEGERKQRSECVQISIVVKGGGSRRRIKKGVMSIRKVKAAPATEGLIYLLRGFWVWLSHRRWGTPSGKEDGME